MLFKVGKFDLGVNKSILHFGGILNWNLDSQLSGYIKTWQ
jgi:hypothetical protein